MNRGWIVAVVVVLASVIACAAQDVETEPVNLSADRGLGVGMQLDFPMGGLISTRYWVEPSFGIEGILFVWGYDGDVEGTLTVRSLYRIADAPVVDFYGVVGATIPFSTYGYGPSAILVSAAGGIEFGFRFAPNLAWNIEFGISVSGEADLQMVFGTGIHFYFLDTKPAIAED